jgi:hypothetical protein
LIKEFEIPINLQTNIRIQSTKSSSTKVYNRLFLRRKGVSKFELYYIQISTEDNNFDNNNKAINFRHLTSDFNGNIVVFNSNNEIKEFNHFQKGRIKKYSKDKLMSKENVFCTYLGWYYPDGRFEPITEIGCTTTAGDPTNNDPIGYGNYPGGGGNPDNVNRTDSIITLNLYGKEKCINSLLDSTGNSYVKKYLINLKGLLNLI